MPVGMDCCSFFSLSLRYLSGSWLNFPPLNQEILPLINYHKSSVIGSSAQEHWIKEELNGTKERCLFHILKIVYQKQHKKCSSLYLFKLCNLQVSSTFPVFFKIKKRITLHLVSEKKNRNESFSTFHSHACWVESIFIWQLRGQNQWCVYLSSIQLV